MSPSLLFNLNQSQFSLLLTINKIFFNELSSALDYMAHWVECQPVNRKVAGWIPSQGTYLGYRPGPQ